MKDTKVDTDKYEVEELSTSINKCIVFLIFIVVLSFV